MSTDRFRPSWNFGDLDESEERLRAPKSARKPDAPTHPPLEREQGGGAAVLRVRVRDGARSRRGLACGRRGAHGRARRARSRLAIARNAIGKALLVLGRPREAAAELERGVKQSPKPDHFAPVERHSVAVAFRRSLV
jgi:hypothetical protein